MSTLVTKYIQLGTDSTVSKNYVISTPVSPDGSLRISNGVVGNATDVMVIKPTTIQFSQNIGIGKAPTTPLDINGEIRATSFSGDGSALTNLPIREAFNATGSAPVFACRAWVNFNGTGTVAIRASGNVSSITDNGVGNYIVKFTTAMSDANYSAIVTGSNDDGSNYPTSVATDYSTSSIRIGFANNLSTGSADQNTASVAIFR